MAAAMPKRIAYLRVSIICASVHGSNPWAGKHAEPEIEALVEPTKWRVARGNLGKLPSPWSIGRDGVLRR